MKSERERERGRERHRKIKIDSERDRKMKSEKEKKREREREIHSGFVQDYTNSKKINIQRKTFFVKIHRKKLQYKKIQKICKTFKTR